MHALGAYQAIMLDGGGSTILTASIAGKYQQVSHSPVWIRPVSDSLAFWSR
jgi:exopolysaccharide biosynthesis protein